MYSITDDLTDDLTDDSKSMPNQQGNDSCSTANLQGTLILPSTTKSAQEI
jgi:hypothetical protein